MKILVTGASGFIGGHLMKELRNNGHDVIGISLRDGDLTHRGIAEQFIRDVDPDIVVHLAGVVGRLFGERDPEATIKCNTLSTVYIAQVCAAQGIRLVYASTSEAFGDHGDIHVAETVHGVLPYNLYGLSKRWAEEAARLYCPDGLQLFRLSMPFGPGLPGGVGRAAIITFLWNAHYRKQITVHRGGKRCWCWIGDTVRGVRMLIENGGTGVWTVGRDDNEATMLRVAELACDIAGAPRDLITEIDPPSNQTVIKRLNTERLLTIGWQPTIDLEQGMRLTYDAVKRYDEYGRPPE